MANLVEIKVPDIGDFKDVKVIELTVKAGDTISVDDPLITLESDKATIDVPAPQAGVVKELKVKIGDKVSQGSKILLLESAAPESSPSVNGISVAANAQIPAAGLKSPAALPPGLRTESSASNVASSVPAPEVPFAQEPTSAVAHTTVLSGTESGIKSHASPSVRRFARELGVNLALMTGTGLKGRIFRSDVEKFIKSELNRPARSSSRLDLLPWPQVDFAKFGEVERKPLSRIRNISKANLARNWVMIPHVTQFDEADVTELEMFRREINESHSNQRIKVTMLALIMKALVPALRTFPYFNSSLEGDDLILKKYFHIGFAADTVEGLVVPVVRDVDKKGILQIARETGELAEVAREGKLKPTDMQGGCFTVSSLGGIGGTAFTPIINAPEVAVLGVSKLVQKPVYRGEALMPRMILPLSLSYDHRVIDGATAIRFTTFLAAALADMRRVLL